MELKEITNLYKDHPNTADFINELKNSRLTRIHLKGRLFVFWDKVSTIWASTTSRNRIRTMRIIKNLKKIACIMLRRSFITKSSQLIFLLCQNQFSRSRMCHFVLTFSLSQFTTIRSTGICLRVPWLIKEWSRSGSTIIAYSSFPLSLISVSMFRTHEVTGTMGSFSP